MSIAELVDLLGRDFMQRALLAALLTGLAAPAIGTFLVQRRLALLGDGIGHVAVTGVALGLLTGASPTWTAVVVAILGAVLIEVIREQGHTNGDVALALLFYGGLAGGVLITGLAGEGAASLQVYLFGSVTSISSTEVWYTAGLAVVVLTITLGLLPQLFAVASDPEFARVAGLQVRFYNLLVAVLAAVSVPVAMRTVGLLLVSALWSCPSPPRSSSPGPSGRPCWRRWSSAVSRRSAGWSSAPGCPRATVAPGPSIVLLALVDVRRRPGRWAWWLRRRRRLYRGRSRSWRPTPPTGTRSPGTRSPATPRTTSTRTSTATTAATPRSRTATTRYVHDGHRHAPHGEHDDEH